MSFFSYALGALILILVLLRQVRVRPVPRVFQPRLPVVLGVIGLFEMVVVRGQPPRLVQRLAVGAWARMLVGALGLGVLRGLSMRVWTGNGWVLRQGNAITMALWLVSLLVHFVGDAGAEPRRRGRARGGELPPLPRRDPRRAVLRRVPPGPAAVGPARTRRRPAAAGAASPRLPAPSSPPSAAAGWRWPGRLGRPGAAHGGRRDRRRHHRRRGGRGRRRPRAARAARAPLIVPYTRRP